MLQLRIDPKFPEPKPVVSVTPAAAAIARKWQKGLGLAYGVAAVVYVINGWITQSGLVGFLTAFEIEAIGFALDWLTICLAAFILVIPLMLAGFAVEKLAPAIGNYETAPHRQQAAAPSRPIGSRSLARPLFR